MTVNNAQSSRWRRARMDVQRRVEFFQCIPKHFVLRFVEVVPERVVIDQRAAETQTDGAPKLGGGRFRVLQRDRSEAGETIWVIGDHRQQVVVGPVGVGDRDRRVRLHLDSR